MTFNRRRNRTSRDVQLDVESLGDRIAPAVFHHGLVSLNLVVENFKPNHELDLKKHHHEKTNTFANVKHEKLVKASKSLELSTSVSLPMDKPTVVMTSQTGNSGPAPVTNPVYLPMDKPTVVMTSQTGNSGPAPASNPVYLPMDKPTVVTTTTGQTDTGGPVVTTYKGSLPMDRPTTGTTVTGQPENVDQALVTIYQEYENDPSGFTGNTSTANGADLVIVQGDDFGIEIHDGNPAEFQSLMNELTNAGMNVTASSATYGTAVGLLPISELLTVAKLSPTIAIMPESAPVMK